MISAGCWSRPIVTYIVNTLGRCNYISRFVMSCTCRLLTTHTSRCNQDLSWPSCLPVFPGSLRRFVIWRISYSSIDLVVKRWRLSRAGSLSFNILSSTEAELEVRSLSLCLSRYIPKSFPPQNCSFFLNCINFWRLFWNPRVRNYPHEWAWPSRGLGMDLHS